MFIPLEGENVLCLANVVAIYRSDEGTLIIGRDGSVKKTGFAPPTLRRRQVEFWNKSAIDGRSLI